MSLSKHSQIKEFILSFSVLTMELYLVWVMQNMEEEEEKENPLKSY
jgi:hypothetical protein